MFDSISTNDSHISFCYPYIIQSTLSIATNQPMSQTSHKDNKTFYAFFWFSHGEEWYFPIIFIYIDCHLIHTWYNISRNRVILVGNADKNSYKIVPCKNKIIIARDSLNSLVWWFILKYSNKFLPIYLYIHHIYFPLPPRANSSCLRSLTACNHQIEEAIHLTVLESALSRRRRIKNLFLHERSNS